MKFTSQVLAAASGSVGGVTYSRNRYGMYQRRRAVPVNPATGLQLAVRSALTAGVNAWTALLDDAERAAWTLYAANVPMIDRLGQSQNLSGQAMFLRTFVFAEQVIGAGSGASFYAAPTTFDLGDFTTPVPTWSEAGGLSLAFTNTDAWAGEAGSYMGIFQGTPQNPSRTFFKGPFRLAGSIAGLLVPPVSPKVIAAASLPFVVTEGQLEWTRVRVLRADGRLSTARVIGPDAVGA
jgi:hypothetical protein